MLEQIAGILRRRIGLDPDVTGEEALRIAVRQAMHEAGETSWHTYAASLECDEERLQALVEQVVVPETWFFRDGGPFEYLERLARDTLSTGKPLRVLSAPCASGEEAASVAIALRRAGRQAEVAAVDISRRLLERARGGFYTGASFRQWQPAEQWLQPVDSGWQLHSAITQSIAWRRMNLLEPTFAFTERYDAVFCRNLLIYLTQEARRSVLNTLHNLLSPGGVLFLGHSEQPGHLAGHYERVRHPAAFAWRKLEA